MDVVRASKRRDTVLMITPYFPPHIGGIENHVHELSGRLSEHWNIVILTTGTSTKRLSIGSRMSVMTFRPWINPMNNPVVPFMLLSGCNIDCSLIHVHGLYQLTTLVGLIISKITRCPSIVTMHGKPDYKSFFKRVFQRVYERSFLKLLLKRFHMVIATTDSDCSFLLSSGVRRNRIRKIPNAVDTSYWSPTTQTPTSAMSGTKQFILFVGALIERKNCELVLESFRNLLLTGYAGNLKIIGSGPDRESLMKRSKMLAIDENVEFESAISKDSLRELYRTAQVLVHPSKMEGLPTVVLEAMSTGALVISSDIDAVNGLIVDGVNGFLFDLEPANLFSILQKTLALSKQERARICANARKTVVERFNWSNVAKMVARTYLDCSHDAYQQWW